MSKSESHLTIDHDEIRRWVEAHHGRPATVTGTAQDQPASVLRIDFPGGTGEGRLQQISWDDWFRKFDDADVAFLYEQEKAGGSGSAFFRLVCR